MKSAHQQDIFEKFMDPQNFRTAFERIAAKGAAGGLDKVTVELFREDLDRNLDRLRSDLVQGKYVPEPVRSVYVPKFNEMGDYRKLGLPTIADKVAQAALLQVVQPLGEELFSDSSFAYRPGRGPRQAIQAVEINLRERGLSWVFKADVADCFESFSHDRLLQEFGKLVGGDPRLVKLVEIWCKMGSIEPSGKWSDTKSGVRQGQVLSPFLANLYLHPLDQFATGMGWGWARYGDDFLLQCSTREMVTRAAEEVERFVSEECLLSLNKNKSLVAHVEDGFVFLGIQFKGERRSVAQSKVEKFRRRLDGLLDPQRADSPETLFERLNESLQGFENYYGFLNPVSEFRELHQHLVDRLRELVRIQVERARWPANPPADLILHRLGGGTKRTSTTDLAGIWRSALRHRQAPEKSKAPVEKAIKRQRRRYRREEICGGDVYVTTPGHFIGCRGQRIIVRERQKHVFESPIIRLRSLNVAQHGVTISTDALRLCLENDIPVCFLDKVGRTTGVVHRPHGKSAELSLQQVLHAEGERGRHLARMFVLGKIKNQRAALKYFAKYRRRDGRFAEAVQEMEPLWKELTQKIKLLQETEMSRFREKLMGLEGAIGARYWRLFALLLGSRVEFPGRVHQGAGDLVNACLNYGYGLLSSKVLSHLNRVGLNPASGFLHSIQRGRPSLVYDLMENFRPGVVDRTLVKMVHRGEKVHLDRDGKLTQESRKRFIQRILERLGTEVCHRGERLVLDEVIHQQCQEVKGYLMNGHAYHPYLDRW